MVETFLGIQIISLLFAFYMVYMAFIHWKTKNIHTYEFLFWLVLWVIFTGFIFYPRILDPFLAKLFIARRMDLLMFGSFMILAYLGFQNHIGVKSLQNQMEKLVRKYAQKNAKTKK